MAHDVSTYTSHAHHALPVLKRSGPFEKTLAAFNPNPSLPYLPSKRRSGRSNTGTCVVHA